MMNITAGKYKGRKVIAPDENITRPTLSKTREAVFSCLYSMIDFDDKTFLDMFSGSGIMALEAISRGFNAVLFEKNLKAVNVIKENFRNLELKPDLIVGDSLKLIKKIDKRFDVIYIDPPYMSGIYECSLELIQENHILNENGIIILEHTEKIDLNNLIFKPIKQKSYSKKTITFLS